MNSCYHLHLCNYCKCIFWKTLTTAGIIHLQCLSWGKAFQHASGKLKSVILSDVTQIVSGNSKNAWRRHREICPPDWLSEAGDNPINIAMFWGCITHLVQKKIVISWQLILIPRKNAKIFNANLWPNVCKMFWNSHLYCRMTKHGHTVSRLQVLKIKLKNCWMTWTLSGLEYNKNKLAPYGTGGRLLLTANFSHRTQKVGQKSTI